MYPIYKTHADIMAGVQQDNGVQVIGVGPHVESVQAFMDNRGQSRSSSAVAEFIGTEGAAADWYYGNSTWKQALDWLRFGWRDGMKMIEPIIKTISANLPKAKQPVYHYRPTVAPIGGLRINFHDIISGGPQPFIGRFRGDDTRHGNSIIKIAVNSCYSMGVPAEVAAARGAAIMALIHQLTVLRKTVDVTIVFPCRSSNLVTVWHVLPAGYPVNMDSLAFSIIHPSALRRIGHVMHAYVSGHASYYPAPLRDVAPHIADRYDLVIESDCAYDNRGQAKGMRPEWTKPASQVAWVKDQLKGLGFSTF